MGLRVGKADVFRLRQQTGRTGYFGRYFTEKVEREYAL